VQLVKELETSYGDVGGKTIVYARSRDVVERLADLLSCPFIHSRQTDARKGEVLERLQARGVFRVVATSALGVGVDVPDIRSVVHVESPNSLRDYAQESGRAGRNGGAVQAIILTRRRTVGLEVEIQAFISTQGCRRAVLDGYLDDDTSRACCQVDKGEKACDNCSSMLATRLGESIITEDGGYDATVPKRVKEQLNPLHIGHSYCNDMHLLEADIDVSKPRKRRPARPE